MPDLYSDPLFMRSSYWVLSTSAVFSKHFDAYGWGEVVPDGFGVAYMTGFEGKHDHSSCFTLPILNDLIWTYVNFAHQTNFSSPSHRAKKCRMPNS